MDVLVACIDVNGMRAVPEREPVGDHARHSAISGPSGPNTGSVVGRRHVGNRGRAPWRARPCCRGKDCICRSADRRRSPQDRGSASGAGGRCRPAARRRRRRARSIVSPLSPPKRTLARPRAIAHRLVDHRMIVDVRINAVAPHAAPAIGGKGLFDRLLRGRASRRDRWRRDKGRAADGLLGILPSSANVWVIGAGRVLQSASGSHGLCLGDGASGGFTA